MFLCACVCVCVRARAFVWVVQADWAGWAGPERTDYLNVWGNMVTSRFEFSRFASDAELSTILGSESYANSNEAKVAAAVVFDSFPAATAGSAGDVSYKIRLNFTSPGARPVGNSPFAPPSQPLVCYSQEGCGSR